jgi:hypothetical protein
LWAVLERSGKGMKFDVELLWSLQIFEVEFNTDELRLNPLHKILSGFEYSAAAMFRRSLVAANAQNGRNRSNFRHMLLGLGQYFPTLKSDSDAEPSFLQFFFYPKNLPEAPHPLTFSLRFHWRHDKDQPNLRTLWDELISIEENSS